MIRVTARAGLGLLAMLCMPMAPASAASGADGLWLTQDRGGIIAVRSCGTNLCARIVGLVLDKPTEPTPLDAQGVSQCGLELINDAAPAEPNLWRGHIRDPRNGSVWGVQLWLNPNGTLSMRGYFGISLLGRTETWTRYPGTVPQDCRMSRSDVAAALRGR
ncbi:MAG: DUF2147 domain-containing protein [Proteobacteria bacterium]|nr:DUF2147 domain-containing protein [Pseudomonadota bacterium]